MVEGERALPVAGRTAQFVPAPRSAPAEIAAFVAFLASDDASFVTGASLAAAGGLGAAMAT